MPTLPPVKWVPGLSRGAKCGRGVLVTLTPPLYRRGHGRVQLYLYPPSGPHRACNGNTLAFFFYLVIYTLFNDAVNNVCYFVAWYYDE